MRAPSLVTSGAGSKRNFFREPNWRELCDAAAKEQDPEKLRTIISELIKVLDERTRTQHTPGDLPQNPRP